MHNYAEAWREGRFKLAVTATLLAYRREHAALFEQANISRWKRRAATRIASARFCAPAATNSCSPPWHGSRAGVPKSAQRQTASCLFPNHSNASAGTI